MSKHYSCKRSIPVLGPAHFSARRFRRRLAPLFCAELCGGFRGFFQEEKAQSRDGFREEESGDASITGFNRDRQVTQGLGGRAHHPPPEHPQSPPLLLHHQLLLRPYLYPVPTNTHRWCSQEKSGRRHVALCLPRPSRSRLGRLTPLPLRADSPRSPLRTRLQVRASYRSCRVQRPRFSSVFGLHGHLVRVQRIRHYQREQASDRSD